MNASRLDYFAANAPEVPEWYANKFTKEGLVSSISLDELSQQEQAQALKSEYYDLLAKQNSEIYFSWRKYYAEQMILSLGGDL